MDDNTSHICKTGLNSNNFRYIKEKSFIKKKKNNNNVITIKREFTSLDRFFFNQNQHSVSFRFQHIPGKIYIKKMH